MHLLVLLSQVFRRFLRIKKMTCGDHACLYIRSSVACQRHNNLSYFHENRYRSSIHKFIEQA